MESMSVRLMLDLFQHRSSDCVRKSASLVLRHNELERRVHARAEMEHTSVRSSRHSAIRAPAFELFHAIRSCIPRLLISIGQRELTRRGALFPHTMKSISATTIKKPKRKSFCHTAKAMMSAATMMDIQYHETSFSRYSNSGASHVISNFAMILF